MFFINVAYTIACFSKIIENFLLKNGIKRDIIDLPNHATEENEKFCCKN